MVLGCSHTLERMPFSIIIKIIAGVFFYTRFACGGIRACLAHIRAYTAHAQGGHSATAVAEAVAEPWRSRGGEKEPFEGAVAETMAGGRGGG